MPPELYLGGVALAPVIAAVIAGLRLLGLPKKFAPWANFILMAVAYAGVIYVTNVPESLDVATFVLNTLVGFLAVAGLYDRTQKLAQKFAEKIRA